MLGTWVGTYQHSSNKIPAERRKQATKFTIEIKSFDGVRFSGNITDDQASAGMRGVGKVHGKVLNGKLTFIKQMPIRTYLLSDGTLIEEEKPHFKIHYSGTKNGDQFEGVWKIKFRIGWVQKRLALFPTITGSWEMKKLDVNEETNKD